jgi:hypothetical protein
MAGLEAPWTQCRKALILTRLGGQVAAVSRALSMAVPVVLVVTAAVVTAVAPFASLKSKAEKYCSLICCERKTLYCG